MTMPNDLICPDFGLKKGYYYSGGIAFWVWTGLNRHFSQDWAVVSGCKWCKWCQSPLSRVTWPSPTARVHQVVTHGSLMMLVFWMFRGDLRFEFTTACDLPAILHMAVAVALSSASPSYGVCLCRGALLKTSVTMGSF